MTNEYLRTSKGKNDECYTPRYGVEPLLEFMLPFKDKIIWCPFDTEESEFVKVFSEYGYNVVYSHIEYGQDFFEYEPNEWDVIISNPPYTNKRAFWERCLGFGKPFTLLLPLNILSDSVINTTMKGKEDEFCLLIPSRRTKFYNAITKQVGNSPTFKASYFGYKIFEKPIILADLDKE